MFWKDAGAAAETYRSEIMKNLEEVLLEDAYIVASCRSDFTDDKSDNPPHRTARTKYEGIVDAGHFLCTHEYPDKKKPQPIVFTIGPDGFGFGDERRKGQGPAALAAAVSTARGATKPPATQVGFGAVK